MSLICMIDHKNWFIFLFSFLCLVSYNGELYIFGGYNARLDRHFNDLWKFNPGYSPFIYVRLGKCVVCCCKALLLIVSFLVAFLCLALSNFVFDLPALMTVYLYRGNAALAVLACVDPLSSSLFCREPYRQSSPPLLHHCQSRDSGWLLPVHCAECETQMPCRFARNTQMKNWQ